MTEYFLGVDIGGTKSHALIADKSGNALGFGVGGAGNYEGVGFDGFVESLLKQATKRIFCFCERTFFFDSCRQDDYRDPGKSGSGRGIRQRGKDPAGLVCLEREEGPGPEGYLPMDRAGR